MIDPAGVKANTQPPPVVLEELRINNQPAAFGDWAAAIRNPHDSKSNAPNTVTTSARASQVARY